MTGEDVTGVKKSHHLRKREAYIRPVEKASQEPAQRSRFRGLIRKQHLRLCVLQTARSCRVPLVVVALLKMLGSAIAHRGCELPAKIERIVQRHVHADCSGRRLDMGGVSSQRDPPGDIPRSLPGRIRESRQPSRIAQFDLPSKNGAHGCSKLVQHDRFIFVGGWFRISKNHPHVPWSREDENLAAVTGVMT